MADRNLTVGELEARDGGRPARSDLPGAFVELEPVDPARHAAELFAGPVEDLAAFTGWLHDRAASDDPLFFAIRDKTSGRQTTEALYLMIRHAFDDLAARRVGWKCNALNEPSRHAAERLGFTFEGIFHQHMIVKGRNRDTAWFSILDHERPELRSGFERRLDPGNFDGAGRQKQTLRSRQDGQVA